MSTAKLCINWPTYSLTSPHIKETFTTSYSPFKETFTAPYSDPVSTCAPTFLSLSSSPVTPSQPHPYFHPLGNDHQIPLRAFHLHLAPHQRSNHHSPQLLSLSLSHQTPSSPQSPLESPEDTTWKKDGDRGRRGPPINHSPRRKHDEQSSPGGVNSCDEFVLVKTVAV